MHVRVLVAALMLLLVGAPALAAEKPSFGPPPNWVDVTDIPAAPPIADAAAVQTLLDDNQSRLGPDGDTYYNRRVRKVLKPEGLRGLTTFSVTWRPEHEQVSVHALRIIRDGKAIDLLDRGRKMLIIRRERDLERAMLDGRMTASQQIEGLQVGDIVDMAWSHAGRDPVAGRHSYDSEALAFAGAAGRYRVRLSWPAGAPMRWKATQGFGEPVVSQRDGWTWLELDRTNVSAPQAPIGAPLRFRRLGSMETSSFQSWSEISRLMAPLYARAAALPSNSEIRREAAAIAARTSDPKGRAFAALQLVEDKTRYFFIGMGDGGYVPARAEETWSRRFGDCKGKTALLLALLNELGVPAEPALVSLGGGDGMDERLPSLAAFNHVLVRATIGGKVYWLDGTRTGDRSGLDALKPPPHRWALPVRAAGAELERIDMPPLTEPQMEVAVRFDATGGLDAPAPMQMNVRMRGDPANAFRQMAAAASRTELERSARQSFSGAMTWVTVDEIDWKDDAANDAFDLVIKGKADLDWRQNVDVGAMEYKVQASQTQISGFPRRQPGPNQDAPFAVPHPMYIRSVMEFTLPAGGAGFTVRGPNGRDQVGGLEITRSSRLADGKAVFVGEVRSTKPEISAGEAEAANRLSRRLAGDESLIRAPAKGL